MPYRRRSYTKRRPRRFRRYNRRRSYKRKSLTFRPHKFVRTYRNTVEMTSGAANPLLVGQSFQLSSMPGYSELIGVYDQYKITGIKVTFDQPYVFVDSDAVDIYGVILHMAYDFNNTGTVTINELAQRPSYKQIPLTSASLKNGRYSVFFRPQVAGMVYEGSFGTGYQGIKAPWIDINDVNVPHFGLQYALEAVEASGVPATFPQTTSIRQSVKYYFQMRMPN